MYYGLTKFIALLLDNQICVHLSHVRKYTNLWLFQRIHTSFLTEVMGCYIFIVGNLLWTGDFVTRDFDG